MKRKPSRRRANGEGSVYPLANGRWRAALSLTDSTGKTRRIYRTARSQADAVASLAELRKETESAATLEPSRMTVSEYLEKWLDQHVVDLADNTRISYRTAIRNHISPRIGKILLKKLAPIHVTQWLVDCDADKIGPRARQAAFAALRSAMNHAVSPLRLLSVSPCESIKAPRHEREDIRPFEVGEVAEILKASRGTRLHALLALAFGTGMRSGELLGLLWSHVDLKRERVTVAQQMTEADGPAKLAIPKTKSSLRTIAIPKHVIRAIHEHRSILLRDGMAANPIVFPNKVGKLQSKSSLHASWKSLLSRLKIDQRGLHHARHSFATLSLASGVPVASLSKVLGHANPSITMQIYAHSLPSTESATAQAMDRLFG